MTDIRFYHLENEGWDGALPKLMERVISANLKAVIKVKDTEQGKQVDTLLWSYKADSFLPHDTQDCENPARQPVYITSAQEQPNAAECLVLLDADQYDDISPFKCVLYMFDGRKGDVLSQARLDWKKYKDQGLEMSYWQQNPGGGWEQKA